MDTYWRKCSSCKKPIPFESGYWACNVSTCNRPRTFFSFCSVSCWDAHLGLVRHRDSWAEEKKAPSAAHWQKVLAGEAIWPPRPVKEKEEKPAPKLASASPKVVIRRKS
jgi:hypothetical protein